MPTRLDQIVAATRRRVAGRLGPARRAELVERAQRHQPRGFAAALRRGQQDGIAVIAELKKASPSRGLLRADFRVAALAAEFEQAGAAALSVLTDEEFFQGSLANLEEASQACRIPCLCKDFMVDELQVWEARAHRADAILLIVAALSDAELKKLHTVSREAGLDALCEVHDEAELERALAAGCEIIGVNSRDLRTFEVNLQTALRLGPRIPAGRLQVAESGIRNGDDMRALREAGYGAFLMGETLMRAESPGEALRGILAEARAVGARAAGNRRQDRA